MSVRVGIVLFPGSNRDIDAVNALTVAGAEPVILWHEQADLDGVAGILLPGGFVSGVRRIRDRLVTVVPKPPVSASDRTSAGTPCRTDA